jgi:hypothetical protein
MTVTVTVKTHAHEAVVRFDGENAPGETTVPARSTRDFHISGGTSIGVVEGDAPAESPAPEGSHLPLDTNNVPGRAENDKLLGASAADEADKDAVNTTAADDRRGDFTGEHDELRKGE